MSKQKIKQGGYVRHYNSREVYYVLQCDVCQASLVDANNQHYGTYPLDELQPVDSGKVKKVVVYIPD